MSYVLGGLSEDDKNAFAWRYTELKAQILALAASAGLEPAAQTSIQNNVARLDGIVDKIFAGDVGLIPGLQRAIAGIIAALSDGSVQPSILAALAEAAQRFPKDLASVVGGAAGALVKNFVDTSDVEIPSTSKLVGVALVLGALGAVIYLVKTKKEY
jgi:hypothetical protein